MRYAQPLSTQVKQRLETAARSLRATNPTPFMARLIDDTFPLPAGDRSYAHNALAPGSIPLESQFGANRPGTLAFNLEPLGPGASGADRRDTATREMRRMVHDSFGSGALHWVDAMSEPFRGISRSSALNYGAFFGSSFDKNGLQTVNVSYENNGDQLGDLNPGLTQLVAQAIAAVPGLRPVFTTLVAGRDHGSQRMTFLLTNNVRVAELQPLMDSLGLGDRLGGMLQIIGVALGGRFDLPAGSALLGLGRGPEGAELELHVMLDAIPDVPPNFLQLLTMNLRERPRELAALEGFMSAFTPENDVWPGRFSILGIRVSPGGPPKVNLFLRPVEFEIPPSAALVSGTPNPAFA